MSSDMFILFFSLVMVSFTCTVISLDLPNMESSSERLQNAFITIRINSRCLICLICDEITTSHESVYWQIIQLIGTLFKNCKLLMEHFCQTPWIKSKTLQFNHILIVWCILGSVQRRNYKKKCHCTYGSDCKSENKSHAYTAVKTQRDNEKKVFVNSIY